MFFKFRSLIAMVGFIALMRFCWNWGGRRSLSQGTRVGRTGAPLALNRMGGGGGFIAGANGGVPIFPFDRS